MRPTLIGGGGAAPVNESCDLLCGKINIHLQSQIASAISFAPQHVEAVFSYSAALQGSWLAFR